MDLRPPAPFAAWASGPPHSVAAGADAESGPGAPPHEDAEAGGPSAAPSADGAVDCTPAVEADKPPTLSDLPKGLRPGAAVFGYAADLRLGVPPGGVSLRSFAFRVPHAAIVLRTGMVGGTAAFIMMTLFSMAARSYELGVSLAARVLAGFFGLLSLSISHDAVLSMVSVGYVRPGVRSFAGIVIWSGICPLFALLPIWWQNGTFYFAGVLTSLILLGNLIDIAGVNLHVQQIPKDTLPKVNSQFHTVLFAINVLWAYVIVHARVLSPWWPQLATGMLPLVVSLVQGLAGWRLGRWYEKTIWPLVEQDAPWPGGGQISRSVCSNTAVLHGFAETARLAAILVTAVSNPNDYLSPLISFAASLVLNVMTRTMWLTWLQYKACHVHRKVEWVWGSIKPNPFVAFHHELKRTVGYLRYPNILVCFAARITVYGDVNKAFFCSGGYAVAFTLAMAFVAEVLEDLAVAWARAHLKPDFADAKDEGQQAPPLHPSRFDLGPKELDSTQGAEMAWAGVFVILLGSILLPTLFGFGEFYGCIGAAYEHVTLWWPMQPC